MVNMVSIRLLLAFVLIFCLTVNLPSGLSDPSQGTERGPGDVHSSFSGGSGSASDPDQISNVTQLQVMSTDSYIHYALINDIDASETINWNGGDGFKPVGSIYQGFIGSLDGRNFTIANLFIDRVERDVGLFERLGLA